MPQLKIRESSVGFLAKARDFSVDRYLVGLWRRVDYWRFWKAHCRALQGASSCSSLADCLILNEEAASLPETSVTIYQSTRGHSPQYLYLHQHSVRISLCSFFYSHNTSVNNTTLYFIYNKIVYLSGRHVSTLQGHLQALQEDRSKSCILFHCIVGSKMLTSFCYRM